MFLCKLSSLCVQLYLETLHNSVYHSYLILLLPPPPADDDVPCDQNNYDLFPSLPTVLCFITTRNSSCGKVIFSQVSVSHSVYGGCGLQGGAWVAGGMCGGGVHGRGHAWWGDTHVSNAGYYEIWSMSGRYASYWNAFFFGLCVSCRQTISAAL